MSGLASLAMPTVDSRAILPIAALFCLQILVIPAYHARAQGVHQIIIYSGQPAPGIPGATFSSGPGAFPSTPIGISSDGTVLLLGAVTGGGTVPGQDDIGLWKWKEGVLSLLAQNGHDVVGLVGIEAVVDVDETFIDLNGNIGFSAINKNVVDDPQAVVMIVNGIPGVAFQEEDPVLGDFLLHTIDAVEGFNNGRVVIEATIETGPGVVPNDVFDSILVYDRNTDALSVAVRTETAMPGAPSDFVFKRSGMNHRSIGPDGDVIMNLNSENTGNTDLEVGGIFRWNDGVFTMVEVSSVQDSSEPNPLNIYSQTNSSEQVIFQHRISDPGPPVTPIYLEGQKGSPIVSIGDVALGTGATFTSFGNIPGDSWRRFGIFDNGRAFFLGSLSDGSNGLWIQNQFGAPQRVFRTGDPAPDIGPAMTFDGTVARYTMPNSKGRVGFIADAQTIPPTAPVTGLWVGDHKHIDFLLGVGSTIEVAGGDVRTINLIEGDGSGAGLEKELFGRTGRDGKPTKMNADGDLLVRVLFGNNEGGAILLSRPRRFTVNSVRDDSDLAPGDGECNTGTVVTQPETGDEPGCTLRAAIAEANGLEGKYKITFDIPGPGPFLISPETPFPLITGSIILDGYSQYGARPNTAPDVFDGIVITELNGEGIDDATLANGLELLASDSEIKGLRISGFPGSGIKIREIVASGNVIHGNIIGIRAGAIDDLNNPAPDDGNGLHGISLVNAPGNVLGGVAPASRNIISGNGSSGIQIEGLSAIANVVEGNLIGTDSTGTVDIGNGGHGVAILDAADTKVGGAVFGARNIIAGNDSSGVFISGEEATGTFVQGNYIGTDASGAAPLANAANGVSLVGAPGAMIGGPTDGARNVVSGNAGRGINLNGAGASGNVVQGNYVGTDVTGALPIGNGRAGIELEGASRNTIGGASTTLGNLVAANAGDGVLITGVNATGNTVQGNTIGADPTGDIDLRNAGNGVAIVNAPGNSVGDVVPGAGNVVVNNALAGVFIQGSDAINNLIQGNFIGTGTSGTAELGNGAGILIEEGSDNTVGGEADGAGNVVAFNELDGTRIVQGTGNRIAGNSIFRNASLGINLDVDDDPATRDTATPNDEGDSDVGANMLQNSPLLKILGAESTDVLGTLDSRPNRTYRIELFSNTVDPEGETFLGATDVQTDGTGMGAFNFAIDASDENVTATATDIDGNTSEFSAFATRLFLSDLVALKKVSPTAAAIGDTVVYSVGIYNIGPHLATNVEMIDKLPGGLTFLSASPSRGSYAAGSGQWTVGEVALDDTLSLIVTARVTSDGAIKNTATTAGGDQIDPVEDNNSASAILNARRADLAIAKTVDSSSPGVGDTVTFTITASNVGPDSSLAVLVKDSLPVGLSFTSATPTQGAYDNITGFWTVGKLAAAESAVLEVEARVDSTGMITNTAVISSTEENDPDKSNNSASAIIRDDGRSTSARIQLIHAITNVDLETIDVYIDSDLIFDDLVFREATDIVSVSGGPHELAVAPATSTSSVDAVFSETLNLAINETHLGLLFDDASNGVSLILAENVPLQSRISAQVDLAFYNGIQDSPSLDIRILEGTSGEGSLILESVAYGAPAAGFVSFFPESYTFEFFAGVTGKFADALVATVHVDLYENIGKSIAFVVSGFQIPPAGYEGSHKVGVTLVSTDGSPIVGGTVITVDSEKLETLPGQYELFQNYPNPFNPSTTIRFTLPEPAEVSLDIFDLLGRRVLILKESEMTPSGLHEVQLDIAGFGSGLYLYRLQAGPYSAMRRMLLLK